MQLGALETVDGDENIFLRHGSRLGTSHPSQVVVTVKKFTAKRERKFCK
jgi:hypothetical protein